MTGRYPPPQRYYEVIAGRLSRRPPGAMSAMPRARYPREAPAGASTISITGYPSLGVVACSTASLAQFVIDTNRWAFTQPRRPGLREGDVEKVFVEVEYSLTNAKLTPIANMTMHTSAGTFTDRFVLDNLRQQPPGDPAASFSTGCRRADRRLNPDTAGTPER